MPQIVAAKHPVLHNIIIFIAVMIIKILSQSIMIVMEILKIMIMKILSQDHHVKVDFLEFWIMRPGYYACIFLESTGFAIVTKITMTSAMILQGSPT